MERRWVKHYPDKVKADIDISQWQSVASVIEQACKRFPDNIALTCLGNDMTFRQLDRAATHFAGYLQKIGLKKGDRLAIMLPNVLQFPIAFLGAQKLGVVCVNTNPLYTPREMKHQFKDSGAKAIVILNVFMKNLQEIIGETELEHVIVATVGDQFPKWKGVLINLLIKAKGAVPKYTLAGTPFSAALSAGARVDLEAPRIDPDDVAILQYTGGTTGVSKGAVLLQRNILANMAQIQESSKSIIEEGTETVLTALPLYHIFALAVNFLTFLAMGNRMILVPKPIPIENVIKIFEKYKITVLTAVNTLFNALVNHSQFKDNPPANIKLSLGGGMAVQRAVNDQWQNIVGQPIIEGFGLTEASPVTHCNPINNNHRIGSIGTPVPSTYAKVVDENGQEVPHGEAGELIVKGPQVMAGYWQRPEETSATIKDGWLWTGDMAKTDDDGFFYIVDRKKDMILVSGFNVFPNEIEDVLASHAKVLEAAVVGVPDDKSGEAVKAFVVASDKTLTIEELKRHCSEQLTGYKRPRHFEFRDELPKTNVGKILRRELRDTEVKPNT